ncbi:MAG: lactonase family protein [Gemmataceae bacterium]
MNRLLAFGCLLLAGAFLLPQSGFSQEPTTPKKLWVFLGTYTRGNSKGIYRAVLDLKTGKLGEPQLAAVTKNPSFLAIHPTGDFLYSVGELSEFKGKPAGAVNAFSLDPMTGKLKFLNQRSSKGAGPCHLVVDKTGKYVLVANYGGGSVTALRINKKGRLGKTTAFIQHKGSSVNPRRQKGPHAHSINLDAANRFAFVADLGLDKVLIYKFSSQDGSLKEPTAKPVKLAPGAGPRHFAFHPSRKFAYVINEMTSTLTAMKYDPKSGALMKLQTLTTLPQETKGNSTAEVVVHPSGKFVYGSNRGHNSIAIFQVNQDTGKLTPAGHQGYKIKIPRNFAIDPTGKYLLVASQQGHTVGVFQINQDTGALTPTGSLIEVPSPVCVRFLAKPE